MCTVVILRRPEHRWPLLIAANRDEMVDRPWDPPGRHWDDRPNVRAGRDRLAGGSWMGVNDEGVVACVLNRPESLGPDPQSRSRGELPLEALDHADAITAADALSHIDGHNYRSFNMMIADNRDAYWLRSLGPGGDGRVEAWEIDAGVSMLTAVDLNSQESARVRMYLPRFESAQVPDPDISDWSNWETLLSDRTHERNTLAREALAVVTDMGFCTVSSSLVALPAIGAKDRKPAWLFCGGMPEPGAFQPVDA